VNFIKATFLKKPREILRDADKTLSLSVFVAVHKKHCILEKAERNAQRRVKKEKKKKRKKEIQFI
jgi:hypothetical protein